MTMLDRYVARIVIGAFGAAMLFFLFITILLDLLNSLPKYVANAAKHGLGGLDLALQLAQLYINMLPVVVVEVTPFVTVIASMFAVARLQSANEVVPMLFVGRSIQRVLRPMLVVGALAGLAMAGCWQWVVPRVAPALAAGQALWRMGSAVQKDLVHETSGDARQRLYAAEYDPLARRMKDLRMLVQTATGYELIEADSATWSGERADWRLDDGWLVWQGGRRPHGWLARQDITPEILLQRGRESLDPDTLSYTDLLATIELRPNRTDVRLALHRHVTYPLANLLLLLLALPLAIYFERGSRIERLLGAIGLCGAYMLVDLTCQSLGRGGHIHPVVAAWTPTIVFGALGITLFGGSRT